MATEKRELVLGMKQHVSAGLSVLALLWVIPTLAGPLPYQGSLIIDGAPVITVLGDEPVLGVRRGTVARAYSLWQLNHHEIVNDQVGDLPLAITW